MNILVDLLGLRLLKLSSSTLAIFYSLFEARCHIFLYLGTLTNLIPEVSDE